MCSRSPTSAAGRRSLRTSSPRRRDRSPRSSRQRGCQLPADTQTAPLTAPVAPRPRPRSGARHGAARAGELGLGLCMVYMAVFVLIPLAAVVVKAFSSGVGTLWSSIDNTLAVRALVITLVASLIVAAIGAVMGTLVAWVLVRDSFPGKRFVNALIDLPFALPTVVAGLTLIALYGPDSPVGVHLAYTRGAVVVALLFVTLPFVVRSVQPVLIELDQEVEEAAASLGASNATTFRRIVLPALRPAIFSGAALAFARSIGEFGSLALIAGKVQIASIVIYADIESGSEQSAAALSVVLMLLALIVLFILRRVGARIDR
ncbi:MAG TPA: sulfate ABC transporter permease subunit CysT [Solirubrobacteraceae bacterium]|nr:sulfate ABC transporter permease subunit CysT [Solirubrobacteraceae bacterium]